MRTAETTTHVSTVVSVCVSARSACFERGAWAPRRPTGARRLWFVRALCRLRLMSDVCAYLYSDDCVCGGGVSWCVSPCVLYII